MKVVFRVDASLQIGTGHVMRCLTLADALAARGVDCQFICRAHPGNLIEVIRSKGYVTHTLPVASDADELVANSPAPEPAHSHWLGVTQAQDADTCAVILDALQPDWLIVDHYALDARWERAVKHHYRKLMVIDDLADRSHLCDVLLDQTFGRNAGDYRRWVPADCELLCGSQYALLRPEFAALRSYSLQRRAQQPALRQLLISMGGVDKDNATVQVLDALRGCSLSADCQIVVVMGLTAPWLDEVQEQAQTMPWPTRVLVGVTDMAQLMADSDLAIGAAGATSWERCCLGLPTIMLVLAENQRYVAQSLAQAGAALTIELEQVVLKHLHKLFDPLIQSPVSLLIISQQAASIVKGDGLNIVIQYLES